MQISTQTFYSCDSFLHNNTKFLAQQKNIAVVFSVILNNYFSFCFCFFHHFFLLSLLSLLFIFFIVISFLYCHYHCYHYFFSLCLLSLLQLSFFTVSLYLACIMSFIDIIISLLYQYFFTFFIISISFISLLCCLYYCYRYFFT